MEDDPLYSAYKADNSGLTYSQWALRTGAPAILNGGKHATLGRTDWREGGKSPFRKMVSSLEIEPYHRVIAFGCGTLRIGGHFIEYLDAGNFIGMDVTDDLFGKAAALVGKEILEAKMTRLLVISPETINEASAFQTDRVYSAHVAYHVHPDEKADYLCNLKAISAKPGCKLWVDVMLGERGLQFMSRHWMYDLETYVDALAPMKLIK